jgi:hypothetical protein
LGKGSPWTAIVPDKSPLLGGMGSFGGWQLNATFPTIDIPPSCFCADCTGGPPVIPSGHCAPLCLSSSFVDCSALPTAGVTGGPIAVGITPTECGATGYAGPYTVTIIGSNTITDGGVTYCEVLTGTFSISVGVICSVTKPMAAIEADGPRRWTHVGIGSGIATYDTNYSVLFTGSIPVNQIRRLRADPRFGSLAILGITGTTYSTWLSTDGGQTANKVGDMIASSSVMERDSERNWLLWFTADDKNQVSLQVSEDGGQSYAAPVDVKMDDGSRMQAALLDTCQDCRSGGRVGLVCSVGKDPSTPGPTSVMVSDDGGLTFRKVV